MQVELIGVTSRMVEVRDPYSIEYGHMVTPDKGFYVRNSHLFLPYEEISHQEEIHKINTYLDGKDSTRLISVHPSVAEVLFMPEIKDTAIKSRMSLIQTKQKIFEKQIEEVTNTHLALEEKYKTLQYNLKTASFWERLVYVFNGFNSFVEKESSL